MTTVAVKIRRSPSGPIETQEIEVKAPAGTPSNYYLNSSGEWLPIDGPAVAWDLWVDATNGNDSNPGTEAKPVLTIAKALAIMGAFISAESRLHLKNSPAAGWDLSQFFVPSMITANLDVISEDGFEEIAAAVSVTSQTGTLIDCSGASPGWSVDAFRGKMVELIRGGVVYAHASVARNTADTIRILAEKPLPLTPGDSVRIVRPRAKLKAAPYQLGPLMGGAVNPYVYIGLEGTFAGPPPSCIHWINFQITAFQSFAGVHRFTGIVVLSGGSGVQPGGICCSGIDAPSAGSNPLVSAAESVGNGIAISGTANSAAMSIYSKAIFIGSLVAGQIRVVASQALLNVGFSVLNIACQDGSVFRISLNSKGYFGLENSSIRTSSTCAVVGATSSVLTTTKAGGALSCASGSYVLLDNVTFDTVLAAPSLTANSCGIIELKNRDYAELGVATIGLLPGPTLTRPAGAWSPGQSVATQAVLFTDLPTDGGSAIFRSV